MARCFLEEQQTGQGLAGDVQVPEDGHHLVGELQNLAALSLLEMGDRQIEGGERCVEGVALVQERPADLVQKQTSPGVVSKGGGDPPLHPIQTNPVLGASVSRRQSPQNGQQGRRFSIAARLREVVREVVPDAEHEAGFPLGVDEGVRLPQGLKGGFRIPLLDVGASFLDEAPAGAVGIPVLAVEEEIHCVAEQLEGFGEPSLSQAQRGFQIQQDGFVADYRPEEGDGERPISITSPMS